MNLAYTYEEEYRQGHKEFKVHTYLLAKKNKTKLADSQFQF